MFEKLVNLPAWAIVLEVGIPVAVALVLGALVALRRDRSDRSNDNVFTAAARTTGVCLAVLGAYLVISVSQDEMKWRDGAALEFQYAQRVVDHRSVLDPAEAQVLLTSMHAYAVDVLANERTRQPNETAETDADGAMQTMENLIDNFENRQQVPTTQSAALLDSFHHFQDQRAQRLSRPDIVMSPAVALGLAIIGLTLALIMGFYPAGSGTGAKWLQVGASGFVIVALVATPVVLESNEFNRPDRGVPIAAFLNRLDQ